MKISDRTYTMESVAKCCKGGGLWKKHKEPIETFEKMGMFIRLQ